MVDLKKPPMVPVADGEELEDKLCQKGLKVIEVYTEWSGNCTSVLPTLQKLRAEMEDDESMQFLSCPDDIETDIELIAEHKLKSEPLFLVYRNGTLIETIEGANTPAIKRAVKEHFPNPDLEVDDLDENPLYVLRREREKAEAEAEAEKK